MDSTVYILYSEKLDRFYIGHTAEKISERVRKHNSNHKGYTGKANDWELKYQEAFPSKKEAYSRERQIKAKKSRKFIEELIAG
ncbi:GIY-YIG nuclease family protein [Flavobacteriaceae bacterium TK19130]|nr:GIY-YIG nuclease family protein [Thermobacterium salinum]